MALHTRLTERLGLINNVRPAADIVRDIATEAESLLARGAISNQRIF